VIEIEEPPDIRACAASQVPLVWLYSARASKWKSYEPVDGDLDLMRRHRCEHHGDPNPPWRQLELQHPSTIHAGAERVRRELEKNASKENPS
jgi:hypothetical protein